MFPALGFHYEWSQMKWQLSAPWSIQAAADNSSLQRHIRLSSGAEWGGAGGSAIVKKGEAERGGQDERQTWSRLSAARSDLRLSWLLRSRRTRRSTPTRWTRRDGTNHATECGRRRAASFEPANSGGGSLTACPAVCLHPSANKCVNKSPLLPLLADWYLFYGPLPCLGKGRCTQTAQGLFASTRSILRDD